MRGYSSPHVRCFLVPLVLTAVGLIVLLSGCASTGAGNVPQMATAVVTDQPGSVGNVTSPAVIFAATEAPRTSTPVPSVTPTPPSTPEPSATPTTKPLPYVVVVDPGHGGRDLGARHFDADGRMVYHESQVNLELGLLVRDELVRRGFQVVMTREGDYEVNADDRDVSGDGVLDFTVDESQARVDLANAAGGDLLLSLHQNAFEYPDGSRGLDVGGSETYYCADRTFSDESHRFAVLVHTAVVQAFYDMGYEIRDRGIHDDAYLATPGSPRRHLILLGPQSERIVRPSMMPGALSEPLFITHEIEGQMARDPDVLERLALAYADAVQAFFEGIDPRE